MVVPPDEPTAPAPVPPPTPFDSGFQDCGFTAPVVNDVRFESTSQGFPELTITYDASDRDGDLLPGTFFLFFDTSPDGELDVQEAIDDGRYLAADLGLDGERPCTTTELVLPLTLDPESIHTLSTCSGYDWAAGVTDEQGNTSQLVLVTAWTPDTNGATCGPTDTATP